MESFKKAFIFVVQVGKVVPFEYISYSSQFFRWMKSRKLSNSLEGFFLRLRLGKWEKGPGGTGYKVARIISKTLPIHIL